MHKVRWYTYGTPMQMQFMGMRSAHRGVVGVEGHAHSHCIRGVNLCRLLQLLLPLDLQLELADLTDDDLVLVASASKQC